MYTLLLSDSICCFILIAVLCSIELYEYWTNDNVLYKFGVDVDFDERPTLDVDMIVASPCNSLNIMATSPNGDTQKQANENIVKEPSRFEMDPNEQRLWSDLKEAHRQQFQPGSRLKSLNDITFISKSLEQNLQSIAENKVADEADEIRKQRELDKLSGKVEEDRGHQIFMMIGNNGIGMLQVISNNQGPNEGTACRIHGKIPVLKGDGDKLLITPSNFLNLPGLFGSVETGDKNGGINFSHRIERFHFGQHIWGLVTPLSGTEKLSESGRTMYKYFIKVVPTRIHHTFGTLTTYQYAVTSMQRESADLSSISLSYQFHANIVEVYPNQVGLIQLVLRLCAIIGGVFATSSFVLYTLSHIIAVLGSVNGLKS